MDNKHESYVSLETAKLLKARGFDWECKSLYCTDVRYKGNSIDEDEEYELKAEGKGSEIEYVDGGMICDIWNTNNSGFVGYSRPPLAIAQRWLREVKHYHIMIDCIGIGNWKIVVQNMMNERDYSLGEGFNSYEFALEKGIIYCLEKRIKEED